MSKSKQIFFLSILFFTLFISYFKTFDSSKLIYGSDFVRQFYFYRTYFHNKVSTGSFPLWDNLNFYGTPFYPLFQHAVFYPLTYLTVFFHPALGINLSVFFTILLSFIFTFLLVKELTGNFSAACISGIIFSIGGFFTTRLFLGHLTIINSFPYLPAVFWGYIKFVRTFKYRFFLFTITAVSLQIFAGQPQFVFYTCFTLVLFHVYNLIFNKKILSGRLVRSSVILTIAIILGFMLTSIFLLPALKYTRISVRSSESQPYSFNTYWSFEPKKIITLAAPFFFGSSLDKNYWRDFWRKSVTFEEYNGFIGITGVILIIISFITVRDKNNTFFCLLFIVAFLVSLGKYTPFYRIFFNFIPGFNIFRWPVRFMYVFNFAAAIAAGFGIKSLIENIKNKKIFVFILIIFVVMLILSAVTKSIKPYAIKKIRKKTELRLNRQGGAKYHTIDFYMDAVEKMYDTVEMSMIRIFLYITVFFIVYILTRKNINLKYLFIFLVLTELLLFHTKFLKLINSDFETIFKSKLPEEITQEKYSRIFSNSEHFPPCFHMILGLRSIHGYEPQILKVYDRYVNRFEKAENIPVNIRVVDPDYKSNLFNLMNIKYIISKSKIVDESFVLLKEEEDYYIYRNDKKAPSFYFADNLVYKKNNQILGSIEKLNSEDIYNTCFYSDKTVKNEFIPVKHDEMFRALQSCVVQEFSDNFIKLKVVADCPGFLILNEVFAPGWKVRINGVENKITKVNYMFRGIYIDKELAGKKNIIELYYTPPGFLIGLILTVLSVVVIIISYFFKW